MTKTSTYDDETYSAICVEWAVHHYSFHLT